MTTPDARDDGLSVILRLAVTFGQLSVIEVYARRLSQDARSLRHGRDHDRGGDAGVHIQGDGGAHQLE